MNPDDDEAERKLKDKLEEAHADRVETSLHGWQRELIPPGSTAETLAPLATGPVEMPQRARDALARMLIDSTDLGTTVAFAQLDGLGLSMDYTLVNLAARNRAITYGGELVRGIEDTTRRAVNETVGRWIENGEPLSRLTAELAPTFGRARAEAIASTEVTRAYYDGNVTAWRESGLVEKQEWRTAMDERVCPTCGPLNNVQVLIGETWPGGLTPPAHVRCRCWAVPVVEVPALEETRTPPPERKPSKPKTLSGPDARQALAEAQNQFEVDQFALATKRRNLSLEIDEIVARRDKGTITTSEMDKLLGPKHQTMRDLISEQQKMAKAGNTLAQDIVRSKDPAESRFSWVGSVEPPEKNLKKIEQGVDDFFNLLDKKALKDVDSFWYPEVEWIPTHARADCGGLSIRIGADSNPRATLVHELGHWLEANSKSVSKQSSAFYDARTKGSPLEWMGGRYGKDEKTRRDKFINPYMGKSYGSYPEGLGRHRATEIVSMGMEMMHSDPVELARRDPEYFDLIWGIMRGLP